MYELHVDHYSPYSTESGVRVGKSLHTQREKNDIINANPTLTTTFHWLMLGLTLGDFDSIGLVVTHFGLVVTRIGSASIFRYQNVDIGNMNTLWLGTACNAFNTTLQKLRIQTGTTYQILI